MDLCKIFEAAFSADSSSLMEQALNIYGSMLVDDELALDIYSRNPQLHRLILQNVLTNIDCTPAPVMSDHEVAKLAEKRKLVKQGLWCLSNLAAMYEHIN
jgi:hypothetical protein